MVVELAKIRWGNLRNLLCRNKHGPEQLTEQPTSSNPITEITVNGPCWDEIMYNPWGKLFIPALSDGKFIFHLNDGSNSGKPIAVIAGNSSTTNHPIQYAYCETFIGTRSELCEIAQSSNRMDLFFGPAIRNGNLDTLPDWQKPLEVYKINFPDINDPTLILKAYQPEFLTDAWKEDTKPPYIVGIWMDYKKISGFREYGNLNQLLAQSY